ncbi:MAG: hypothetical protein P1S46_05080 [bacterium]|nr:hypothetical protein [bacterium]
MTWRKAPALLIAVLFLLTVWPHQLQARSSFWISSRDTNACIVSAVVQYDEKLEAQVREENGITNVILQMDINTKEPQELCSMLMMDQGENRWRPLLCVTNIRGNIYKGYLILPEEFTLANPIQIRLGDRTVEAKFLK